MSEISEKNLLNHLSHQLEKLKIVGAKGLLLAVSGGMDSMVLLDLVSKARAAVPELQVCVIHIDHERSTESGQWAEFVKKECQERYQLPYQLYPVDLPQKLSLGFEGEARKVRYQQFEKVLPPAYVLMTAHHQKDQCETFFLNVQRGSGLTGLCGIPSFKPFGAGWICRPLLTIPKKVIQNYQQQQRLPFVDDPTNARPDFNRNFLRHQIFPLLTQRWDYWEDHLSQAIQHLKNRHQVLDELGLQLLKTSAMTAQFGLKISVLTPLTPPSQRELLRQWIRFHGEYSYSSAQLENLRSQALFAHPNAKISLKIGQGLIQRYHQTLFFSLYPFSSLPLQLLYPFPKKEYERLILPAPLGMLWWQCEKPACSSDYLFFYPLILSFSECGQPNGPSLVLAPPHPQGFSQISSKRSLKNFYQTHRLPRWVRPFVPQPQQWDTSEERQQKIWVIWQWWYLPKNASSLEARIKITDDLNEAFNPHQI